MAQIEMFISESLIFWAALPRFVAFASISIFDTKSTRRLEVTLIAGHDANRLELPNVMSDAIGFG